MTAKSIPVCLSIAGLDPSGGAGVIADVKTFRAFNCYATAAVTSITFQNTKGVFGAEHQAAGSVRRQIEAVVDDLDVVAIKTGMLPTSEVVAVVAEIITKRGFPNVVVDPVIRSTSGYGLIDASALQALVKELLPLSTLITPNIPETELLTGVAIESEEDIRDAADVLRSMGARNVLIKGGHFDKTRAVDHLFVGETVQAYPAEYIDAAGTHGTGCVLSSAIAANLALGRPLPDAVAAAKEFVTDAIRTAFKVGHGNSPINI